MSVLSQQARTLQVFQREVLGEPVPTASSRCRLSSKITRRQNVICPLVSSTGAGRPVQAADQARASNVRNFTATEYVTDVQQQQQAEPGMSWDIYGRRIQQKGRRRRRKEGLGDKQGSEGGSPLRQNQGSGSELEISEGKDGGLMSSQRRHWGSGSSSANGRRGSGRERSAEGGESRRIRRVAEKKDKVIEEAIKTLVQGVQLASNDEEVGEVLDRLGDAVGDHFQNWYSVLDRVHRERPGGGGPDVERLTDDEDSSDLEEGASWPLVLQIFRFVQQRDWYRPSAFWYSKMIAHAGRAHRPDQAWSLLLEMQEGGCAPTTPVCNALIRSFLVAGMEDEAQEVLTKMRTSEDCQPNTRTYNMFIIASCRYRRLEEAERRIEELRGDGLTPDEFTYGTLLDAYAKTCQVDELEAILQAMLRERCVLSQTSVTASMIACFKKAEHWEGLNELARGMRRKLVQSTLDTWNALIGAYAAGGQVKLMLATYEDLQSAGLTPGTATYIAILTGYKLSADAACVPAVTEILGQVAAQDLPLNNSLGSVYTAAIDAYGALGACDLMAEAFSAMLERGCEPKRATLRALVVGFGNAGLISEMETVYEMLKDLVKPERSISQAMVEAYLRVGDETKADEMRQSQGLSMSTSTRKKTSNESDDGSMGWVEQGAGPGNSVL